MLIGPCALTIIGKPSVAAPAVAAAAPVRNLRREAVSGFLSCSLLIESSIGKRLGGCLGVVVVPGDLPGVNVSRGRAVPASALRVLATPKPANRIPCPPRMQAGTAAFRIVI